MDRARSRRLMSWLADDRWRLVDADDALVEALGYPRDELLGRDLIELTYADDQSFVRAQLEELMQEGASVGMRQRFCTADGRLLWMTSHISLFGAAQRRQLMATVEPMGEAIGEDPRLLLRRSADRILARRRLREGFFGGDMFGEPAFDLLLDLFVQEIDGQNAYTTSLALASGAPMTTALRQISMLVDRGFVRRVPDPVDRRRVMLQLTEHGSTTMWNYLNAAENL
ncbi:PAS domain-containing protein [Sphingomonas adhaesiva]|uniref:PAS domain-containing protein n=1 Tax=Sphingomonas adhaesiva TaxID=28212 RepID=UPI002FFCB8FF